MKHATIGITMFVAVCATSACTHASSNVENQGDPPGWREAVDQSVDLNLDGKHAETIPLFEQWVAKYPDFVEARIMLGGAHERLGKIILNNDEADARAQSAQHFEAAAIDYRKAVTLPGADMNTMRTLMDLYGPDLFDRPAEFESVISEGLERFPGHPVPHAYFITQLARKGAPLEAATGAALAAITKQPQWLNMMAGNLYRAALEPRPGSAALLRVALQFAAEALKLDSVYGPALLQREEILTEQERQKLPK